MDIFEEILGRGHRDGSHVTPNKPKKRKSPHPGWLHLHVPHKPRWKKLTRPDQSQYLVCPEPLQLWQQTLLIWKWPPCWWKWPWWWWWWGWWYTGCMMRPDPLQVRQVTWRHGNEYLALIQCTHKPHKTTVSHCVIMLKLCSLKVSQSYNHDCC